MNFHLEVDNPFIVRKIPFQRNIEYSSAYNDISQINLPEKTHKQLKIIQLNIWHKIFIDINGVIREAYMI